MNVFADLHHSGLFESLRILFVDRLGCELYRPLGEEWFKEGYWKIAEPYNNAPDTINQYLGLDQTNLPEENRLNKDVVGAECEGVYNCRDVFHNTMHKGITFDRFKRVNFDIIIFSIPAHEKPFADLIQKYQPGAKLISQIGNEGWIPDWSVVNNVMASINPQNLNVPKGKHVVFYHQEFSTKIFSYCEPENSKMITSVMNGPMFAIDTKVHEELKRKLPDFRFYTYGASGVDGPVHSIEQIRDKQKSADFIWHPKLHGDGFGHVIHTSYALGRPLITRGSYYRNKLGERLLIDGVTFIDIEKGSVDDLVNRIKEYSQPATLKEMSLAAYKRFREVVDYDKEAEELVDFLNTLS